MMWWCGGVKHCSKAAGKVPWMVTVTWLTIRSWYTSVTVTLAVGERWALHPERIDIDPLLALRGNAFWRLTDTRMLLVSLINQLGTLNSLFLTPRRKNRGVISLIPYTWRRVFKCTFISFWKIWDVNNFYKFFYWIKLFVTVF